MSAEALIRTKGKLVDVERPTFAKDAGGSVVPVYAVHLTSERIFIQPASGAEAVRYGRESNRKFIQAFAFVGRDIQAKDRLTGGHLGSRKLDIQSVRTPGEFGQGKLAHQVLECEETD